MTRDATFAVVENSIREVLPEIDPQQITPEVDLKDLGADSVDRADIITIAMEALDLSIPVSELAGAGKVGTLVSLLEKKRAAKNLANCGE
jgi:polyketide biosynthesis acyl carrier protein